MQLPTTDARAPLAVAGLHLVRRGAHHALSPRPTLAEPARRTGQLITASPAMRRILEQARRVAASKAPVLIEGESGTGKELLAALVHQDGPRAARNFVRVNCAALSESLVESELFGHERGAFTGADDRRAGRFELAHGGTLLLDEISEMSVRLQAKLLRVLEEEEYERVGSDRTQRIDVRIIATTNRRLTDEIAAGAFRADLYYRLSVVTLHVPALRQRPEDIPLLARHFLSRFQREARSPLNGIAAAAMEQMRAYSWPGNVRQLRNAIHRACLLAAGPQLELGDLPPLEEPTSGAGLRDERNLAAIEREAILTALHELGNNRTAAARRLGISTRTLLNKLKRYREGEPS